MNQQQFHPSFSDSNDDFVPGTQKSGPIFLVRDPPPRSQMPLSIQWIKHRIPNRCNLERKRNSHRVPSFRFHFAVRTSLRHQHPSSNSSMPTTRSRGNQKSFDTVPLASTLAPPRRYGFQDDSSFPDARLGHPQRKSSFTQRTSPQRTSTPKRGPQANLHWSLSSFSPGENWPTQVVSEISEENILDYSRSIFSPFTQRKEKATLNVFPLDYTSWSKAKRRSLSGILGYSMRETAVARHLVH